MRKIFLLLSVVVSVSLHAQFGYYEQGTEAERLVMSGIMAQNYGDYERAIYYYEEATKRDSKYADAYYYWGSALTALAVQDDNEDFFKKSFEKYKQATKLDSKRSEFYNDWAYSLMELAKMKDNIKPYQYEAENLLKKTEQLGEQMGAYNLACLFSLANNKKKAIEWLNTMMTKEYDKKMDELSRTNFDEDKDFDNIRQETEFRQFLNKYFPGELPKSFHSM